MEFFCVTDTVPNGSGAIFDRRQGHYKPSGRIHPWTPDRTAAGQQARCQIHADTCLLPAPSIRCNKTKKPQQGADRAKDVAETPQPASGWRFQEHCATNPNHVLPAS
jgi:hypothetical protein